MSWNKFPQRLKNGEILKGPTKSLEFPHFQRQTSQELTFCGSLRVERPFVVETLPKG